MGGRVEGIAGRGALLALGILALTLGCGAGAFACQDDMQCDAGVCASGSCAFPDESCASGLRYGEHAVNGQGGQCVAGSGTTTGASAVGSGTSSSDAESSLSETFGMADDDTVGSSTATLDDGESDAPASSSDGEESSSESTGATQVDPDLVAWYPCDGDGAALLADASGNGHHGICDECPAPEAGRYEGACAFDGTAQVINVPHSEAFELQAFTLTAWALPDPIPMGRLYTVAAKPVGTEHRNSYEIGFNHFGPDEVALMCYGAVDDGVCTSEPIESAMWTQVAMTYDNTEGATLYINGEAADLGEPLPDGIGFDEAPLLIGLDIDDGVDAHPMAGLIDDVRLYSRVLTAEEIAAL